MDFLYFLSDLRTPFLNQVFQFLTYLGQDIPILILICIIYWCINKPLAYRISLSFFLSGLLLQNLKITFRIERPWTIDPGFSPVPSAVPAATGYSFPSGHTQSAAAVYSTLAFHTKRIHDKVLWILLFLLVGLSRMYLGVHTPKDVLTAISLGLLSTCLIQWLMPRYQDTKGQIAGISGLLALISIATVVYALTLLDQGKVSAAYAADCCKAAGCGLGFALGWLLERSYIRFPVQTTKLKSVLRCLVGLVITLALKIGLKKILGASIPAEIIQYFIIILWIIALYPALFVRLDRDFGSKK